MDQDSAGSTTPSPPATRGSTACSSSASRRPTSTAGRSAPRKRPKAVQLPLLRHAAGGRAGRLPAVPALPSGARAGKRARGRRTADRAADRAAARGGTLDEKAGLEEIADQFELSSRQIRRIVQKELGVPPIQLLLTRRLLLAKQLLTETTLPDHRGRVRERLLEPAPVQRRVQRALSDAADPSAQEGDRRRRRDRRTARRRRCSSRIVRPTTGTGVLAVSGGARARRASSTSPTARTRGPCSLGEAKGWIRVTQSPEQARAAWSSSPTA